ncbi:MAG TPA: class I SAM-dependent methyltransferase [Polyangiaceae bacterium]
MTLGRLLLQLKYQFTTVTPAAHELINSRPGNQVARTLQDVFGWGRRFEPAVLPAQLFETMRLAGACRPVAYSELWQPQVRFSTLEGLLFAHSAFPTLEQDAVFFGPDSYRFVRAIEARVRNAARIVDVGCGCGVGAIALARRGLGSAPVVLADVNANALRMAAVNAELASVPAVTVQSDVLREVHGEFDLVIANPPYLRDDAQRTYRDGGGDYGEQLAARITRESIERLSAMPKGGRLLLYTGAAIVSGDDTFLNAVRRELVRPGVRHAYEEIDPDVFSEELRRPAYASVERIAAVLLDVKVAGTRASLPLVAS